MNSAVIKVQDLSKLYRLGQVGTGTLQHDINRWWHRIRGREDPYVKVGRVNDRARRDGGGAGEEYVCALKEVSFEVRQGEVLGIIGRNGAGKSTLLKLLSRVTAPSTGTIKVKGRIASLLEVGTGFHPELSGRENIYLNGAILGMSRREIASKLDEIVDFSGCAAYLETPVKRYSSGMTVRLGFAVAAHLDAEVLIVDEVLAVGDSDFQQRCLGKMKSICSTSGRTVIFVSHNMAAVEMLCDRAIYLNHGMIASAADTAIRPVIMQYLGLGGASNTVWAHDGSSRLRHPAFTPLRVRLADRAGTATLDCWAGGDDVWLHVEGRIETLDLGLTLGYALYDGSGNALYWSFTIDVPEERRVPLREGEVHYVTRLPRRLLNEGSYRLEFAASLHNRAWLLQPGVNSPGLTFQVQGGISDSPQYTKARNTLLAPIFDWHVHNQSTSDESTAQGTP